MTPNIDEFWKLIADSGLLNAGQFDAAQARFADQSPAEICQQLVDETFITPLHRDVILAGHAGPFIYGRYLVTQPLDGVSDDAGTWRSFAGKDLRTQHPVQLTFFSCDDRSRDECHASRGVGDDSGDGDGDGGGGINRANGGGNESADTDAGAVSGRDAEAVQRWSLVEKRVRRLVKCRHRNLIQTYQTIVLPEYRFVVSELPVGVRLSETLPDRGRLKLDEAASVALQVAQAIASQIEAGVDPCLPSQDRLMASIWMGKKKAKGTAKLAPDFKCVEIEGRSGEGSSENRDDDKGEGREDGLGGDSEPSSSVSPAPQRAVVALLMRMAGGAFPDEGNLPMLIEKSGVTGELETIVKATLQPTKEIKTESGVSSGANSKFDAKIDAKIDTEKSAVDGAEHENAANGTDDDLTELQALIEVLESVSGDAGAVEKLSTTDAFRKVLTGSQLHLSSISKPASRVPDIDDQSESTRESHSDDPRVLAARQAAALRKKSRWKTPATVAAALLALVTALGVWSMSPSRTVVLRPSTSDSLTDRLGAPDVAEGSLESSDSVPSSVDDQTAPRAADYSNVAYVQEIIDDDSQRLWESPTSGLPIKFRYVPNTTEILLNAQVSALQRSQPGRRLLQGLSNTFAAATQRLQQSVGVTIEQIQTITVAMYPGEGGKYDSVFIVTTGDEVSIGELVAAWGNPDKIKIKDGQTIYSGDELVYLIIENDGTTQSDGTNQSDNATNGGGISFVAGAARQVQAMAMRDGISVLSRPLQRLAERTDRDRHLTLLTSPKALTDRFGRTLWAEASETIVPQMQIFFPDEVRGFSIGVHVDRGDYLELQIEHSPDISARSLKEKLAGDVQRSLSEMAAFASTLRSLDYWDAVRQRIGSMTGQLVQQLRWDVEFKQVVANAWLPPDATHNLVAASELTLAFADSLPTSEVAADRRSPETIEELLAAPRSLNIANPPDLNILLTQLADDVNDDFPNMPFQLKISLMGNDLQKEGITQNQRPGPLKFENLTLAEMLTKIMVSANPNKNISGPADPECKLVWVVADDGDDQVKRIAITTRAAAAGRGDVLPPAFVAAVRE